MGVLHRFPHTQLEPRGLRQWRAVFPGLCVSRMKATTDRELEMPPGAQHRGQEHHRSLSLPAMDLPRGFLSSVVSSQLASAQGCWRPCLTQGEAVHPSPWALKTCVCSVGSMGVRQKLGVLSLVGTWGACCVLPKGEIPCRACQPDVFFICKWD